MPKLFFIAVGGRLSFKFDDKNGGGCGKTFVVTRSGGERNRDDAATSGGAAGGGLDEAAGRKDWTVTVVDH